MRLRVIPALVVVLSRPLPAGATASYVIETVAGADTEGGPADELALAGLEGLGAGRPAELFLADAAGHRVWRVDLAGRTISAFAGTGVAGLSGDGGPAELAQLDRPYDVAVDARGSVWIADFGNGRIRRVGPDGRIETIAGGGRQAPAAGLPARSVRLEGPRNLAVDPSGTVYFSDFLAHRVWAVTPSGVLWPVAGIGIAGYSGDGRATETLLNGPAGLALDEARGLYIADSGNARIRRVSGGQIETVLSEVPWPVSLAVAADGTVFIAGSGASTILRLPAGGPVSALPASIPLEHLRAVTFGRDGALYVADRRRVWRVDAGLEVRRVAGTDSAPPAQVMATRTRLLGPIGLAIDAAGDLLIAEEGRKAIRRLDAAGRLTTVAAGISLGDPVAVAAAGGELFVADYLGNRVLRISPAGAISVIAGTGEPGYSGDGGWAGRARLDRPRGLALDRQGNLYVADSGNHRVRRITPAGDIATVAGTGVRGMQGDGGRAAQAELDTPAAVALDADGNLYIAERGSHRVRRIDPQGIITTVAGAGTAGFSGDGGPAIQAALNSPAGLAVDDGGNLYIADTGNHRIRRIDRDGVIRTVAGDGLPGFSGDGGPAHLARLNSPAAVVIDATGRLLVADLENGRIRALTPAATPSALEDVRECAAVHAATLKPGAAAPGQLITLFGDGLGAEVRIGQLPAPVLYQDSRQINTRLPEELEPGSAAEIEVLRDGRPAARCRVSIGRAAPGIFTLAGGTGQAAALNEDGTLNSITQPARQGSVLVFYATGEGPTAGEPLPKPVLPVSVRLAGLPVEIEYAGQAPGFPGLMQLNIRLPAGLVPVGELPLELIVGGISSQPGVTIAIR